MKQKKMTSNSVGQYGVNHHSPLLMQRPNTKHIASRSEFSTVFQRDKERILHTKHFKLLKYKSQVMNIHQNQLRKNKLSHTLEVADVAKRIGSQLHLNLELIKAIALGHDLGHAPFGHIGERALHLAAKNKMNSYLGQGAFTGLTGFKHNLQSLHVVDELELFSNRQGLNLTLAVREGIAKHASCYIKLPHQHCERQDLDHLKDYINYESLSLSAIDFHKPSMTLEGQTVAVADQLVSLLDDLREGFNVGCIHFSDLENTFILQCLNDIDLLSKSEKRINDAVKQLMIKSLIQGLTTTFIQDIVESSMFRLENLIEIPKFKDSEDIYHEQFINFSSVFTEHYEALKHLVSEKILNSDCVRHSDEHIIHMMQVVFDDYYAKSEMDNLDLVDYQYHLKRIRSICDEIVASSDESILMLYRNILKSKEK